VAYQKKLFAKTRKSLLSNPSLLVNFSFNLFLGIVSTHRFNFGYAVLFAA